MGEFKSLTLQLFGLDFPFDEYTELNQTPASVFKHMPTLVDSSGELTLNTISNNMLLSEPDIDKSDPSPSLKSDGGAMLPTEDDPDAIDSTSPSQLQNKTLETSLCSEPEKPTPELSEPTDVSPEQTSLLAVLLDI